MVDYLDFFEWLYEFSRDHEDQNIDEIFSVLIFMPIALLMVTFRRQHALEAEIELRQKAEEKIRHLAFYDPLTGLLNRNALEDRWQNRRLTVYR